MMESPSEKANRQKVVMAHGITGALAWVIFFPIGSIIMRVFRFPSLVWIHAGVQIFAYALCIATVGMGIWIATTTDLLLNAHPIIGIIIFGLAFFQSILGLVHHSLFPKYRLRTVWAFVHVWLGRLLITLGIINGGLGLQLSANTTKGEIAYGVIAGVIWCVYMGIVLATWKWGDAEDGKDDEKERRGRGETEKRV